MSENGKVQILVAPTYYCGACGCELVFEPRAFKDASPDAYGRCTWYGCENNGKRIHVRLTYMECEYTRE